MDEIKNYSFAIDRQDPDYLEDMLCERRRELQELELANEESTKLRRDFLNESIIIIEREHAASMRVLAS